MNEDNNTPLICTKYVKLYVDQDYYFFIVTGQARTMASCHGTSYITFNLAGQ